MCFYFDWTLHSLQLASRAITSSSCKRGSQRRFANRVLCLAFVSTIRCRDRTRVPYGAADLSPSSFRMAAIGTRVHRVLRSVASQSDNGVFNNIFVRRFPGLGFLRVVSSSFFSLWNRYRINLFTAINEVLKFDPRCNRDFSFIVSF